MMTLARWQPWQEMETLRRQFDQMFTELAPTREATHTWMPAIELTGSDTELTLRAQLPGMDAKDLEVQVGRKAIALSGEHKFEHKTELNGYFRSEFRYGRFQRVIPLPALVQNDQVKAEFKDGILTLTLPRLQAVQPSVVKVNLVEGTQPEAISPEAISAEHKSEVTASEAPQAELTEDAWA